MEQSDIGTSVLRKVLCSERLPTIPDTYFCRRGTTNIVSSFIPNMPHYVVKWKDVKYWYEEVSIKTELKLQSRIDELIAENAGLKQQLTELEKNIYVNKL